MSSTLATWKLLLESIRYCTQRVNSQKAIEKNLYISKVFLKLRQKMMQKAFCRYYKHIWFNECICFMVIISKDMNSKAQTLKWLHKHINYTAVTWNITNFKDSFRNNISKVSILKSNIEAEKKILSNLSSVKYPVAERVTENETGYEFSCLYFSHLSDEILCDKLYF